MDRRPVRTNACDVSSDLTHQCSREKVAARAWHQLPIIPYGFYIYTGKLQPSLMQ